jgi:crotonobetainyl-CoA:carnitine CoA-transferase CaiB-like acyl-CoA transferase
MALYQRERTGAGQKIDATLFDAGLSLLVPFAANWLYSGRAPRLLGSAHPNICPYDKFRAGDGELFLAVANDGQFERLSNSIGRPDLVGDLRFRTNASRLENRAALTAELEKSFAAHEVQALCGNLMRVGVPAGPVNSVPQAFAQPHAAHRGELVEQDGYRGVASPIRFTQSRAPPVRRPPRFGEHADEVLAEAGYTGEEIAELRRIGVLRDHKTPGGTT